MHRGWWEMRVRYLCRQLTSHTFIRNHDELKTLFVLWERLFTYTVITRVLTSVTIWKIDENEREKRDIY